MNRAYACIDEIAPKVLEFKPDFLVGIPRGGMVVALLLSYRLQALGMNEHRVMIFPNRYPLRYDAEGRIATNEEPRSAIKDKRVLIVDDDAFTGASLEGIKHQFLEAGARRVKTYAVIVNEDYCHQASCVDFSCLKTTRIGSYPWKGERVGLHPRITRRLLSKNVDMEITISCSAAKKLGFGRVVSLLKPLCRKLGYKRYKLGKGRIILSNGNECFDLRHSDDLTVKYLRAEAVQEASDFEPAFGSLMRDLLSNQRSPLGVATCWSLSIALSKTAKLLNGLSGPLGLRVEHVSAAHLRTSRGLSARLAEEMNSAISRKS
jgi:hypoxanthine phosphoribosyltransferase